MSTSSPMASVSIRRCEEPDLPALEWQGMFTAHRAIIEQTFAAAVRGEQVMLVAAAAHGPVGQVWIDLARYGRQRVGLLWALRVHPAFAGRGLGRRLVDAAERELSGRGYRHAEIEAQTSNAKARTLYRQLGYVPARTFMHEWVYHTPDGAVVVHLQELIAMVKPLEGAG